MAASFEVGGVRVDLGSHRLHPSIDPSILRELRDDLGVDLQWRARNGRIRLLGRWLRFPLRPVDLVTKLPPRFALDALRRNRIAHTDTYAEVVRSRFGASMLEDFYGPYARKLWGVEPERLSGEQARRRISASSPIDVARRMLRRERPGFWYPRSGFGEIVDKLAADLESIGGELRLQSEVRSLDDLDADLVWSTIPVTALARIDGGPATALRFRALVLVYVVLDGRPFTSFDAHYLPGPETPFSRVSEPINYRRNDDDPLERTVLCAELPCAVGDEHWTMDDAALGALVARDLDVEPVEVVVRRIPAAYPIYEPRFELGVREIERWLATRPAVVSFGRGGLFAHDNTHHALAEGDAAADCLRDDGTWDAPRWDAAKARFADHIVED
jgi:protoporphyrinogen oxidase